MDHKNIKTLVINSIAGQRGVRSPKLHKGAHIQVKIVAPIRISHLDLAHKNRHDLEEEASNIS